mmetsp:Transcript_11799/g.24897  ORF Transcript_11799/g.24897 Transcript_11799/m.24897 type:complete len:773 (-) Transcript_11799:166-2484(-)
MGTCQSHQASKTVVVADKKAYQSSAPLSLCDSCHIKPTPIKPADISKDAISTASSLNTGMTSLESQELFETSQPCLKEESRENLHLEAGAPIREESASGPEISTVSPLLGLDLPPLEHNATRVAPKHKRDRSEPLIDFFRLSEASCNRVMVHIETPTGVPIEEIYDGVHDGHVLGVGVTGKVRRITHKETSIQRAVKRLDLSLIDNDVDLERLFDEIKIMCALDHPNIVCLEEVYEGGSELYLTQELCDGGDLFDRLEDQPMYCYSEADCARVLRQIISSVSYLHSKNIIHRDLKLENFLFSDKNEHSELKMIDFGLSKHFQNGDVQFETVGTPYTVAPEVILGRGYDEKCDIWAIGVLAYLLLSGETPFGGACEGEDLAQVRENILLGEVRFDPEIWGNVSDLAIDFIKSLLILDPSKRPGAEDVQKHPWMQLMKRASSVGSEEETYLDEKVVNGLVSYKELSHTTKFLCEVLSFTLQPDQLVGLREEFEKMDVEGKGEISLACFKSALLARSDDSHLLSEEDIEDIFNGLKVRNTDMSIRWHEFIAACLSQCHVDDRNIRLAFDRLDSDHKGYITLQDLKNAMDFYHSTRGDLQTMWINNVLDYKSDKDHMTYEDFYKLLRLDESVCPIQVCNSASPDTMYRCNRTRYQTKLHCSVIGPEFDLKSKRLLKDPIARDLNTVESHENGTKRHSVSATLSISNSWGFSRVLDEDELPELVSNVSAMKSMQNVIIGASKLVEDENSPEADHPRRKNALTGNKGLLLRRETSCRL